MASYVEWDRYDDVLHEVYSAAMEPACWPEALRKISELFKASKASLFSFSIPDGKVLFQMAHNISPRCLSLYAAGTANRDPFAEAGYRMGTVSEGNVVIGESHVPRAALIETDFYREVFLPENIGQVCYAIIFDGTDSKKTPVVLSLMRSLDEPSFVEFDRAMLQRMLKHLSRAMGVMFHLRNLEFNAAVSRASLDALAAGVVLLDAVQCITFKNRTAQTLLAKGDPLVLGQSLQHGRQAQSLVLAPRYSAMRPQFERLLRTAGLARMRDDVDHFSDAVIVADSANGRPRCVIHAAPLVAAGDGIAVDAAPSIIVFIYDLLSVSMAPDRLETLFGLTPGEARAAIQLLHGGSANEMAERLGVSINTFKTQIKGAYDKTMTHRQADLLKLLLALGSR